MKSTIFLVLLFVIQLQAHEVEIANDLTATQPIQKISISAGVSKTPLPLKDFSKDWSCNVSASRQVIAGVNVEQLSVFCRSLEGYTMSWSHPCGPGLARGLALKITDKSNKNLEISKGFQIQLLCDLNSIRGHIL